MTFPFIALAINTLGPCVLIWDHLKYVRIALWAIKSFEYNGLMISLMYTIIELEYQKNNNQVDNDN